MPYSMPFAPLRYRYSPETQNALLGHPERQESAIAVVVVRYALPPFLFCVLLNPLSLLRVHRHPRNHQPEIKNPTATRAHARYARPVARVRTIE